MTENIEFISANKLPEAEGDEVRVLCLENGELKQKSATGLGGNTTYDMVVRVTYDYVAEENTVSATGEIISGSYDAVIQKMDDNAIPLCLLIESGKVWGNTEIKMVGELVPWWERTDDGVEYLCMLGYMEVCIASSGEAWI